MAGDLIPLLIDQTLGRKIEDPELILWSYSPIESGSWRWLNRARTEFGEPPGRGSEPDVIIKTENALFFIEAKLTAGNNAKPSNPYDRKSYETGGDNFFVELFTSNYETIAIDDQKYELMRFWLLGNWIAGELNIEAI